MMRFFAKIRRLRRRRAGGEAADGPKTERKDASAVKFLLHSPLLHPPRHRGIFMLLEGLALIAGLFVFVTGIFLWRVSAAPLDVNFVKDYIQDSLRDPVNGYEIEMDETVIYWPAFDRRLTLGLNGVTVRQHGAVILQVDTLRISLYTRYLLQGKIRPFAVLLDRPSLRLVRTEENSIRLSLSGEETPPADEGTEGSSFLEFLNQLSSPTPRDAASPLSRLQRIEIANARLVVLDYKIGATWYVNAIDLAFLKGQRGLAISAHLPLTGMAGSAKNPFLDVDLLYDHADAHFKVVANFKGVDPRIVSRKIGALSALDTQVMPLDGIVSARIGTDLALETLDAEIVSTKGEIDGGARFDHKIPYDRLSAGFHYDRAQNLLDISGLTFRQGDIRLSLASRLTVSDGRVAGPVSLSLPEIPQGEIAPFFPADLKETGAYTWLTRKLGDGVFRDLRAQGAFTLSRVENGTWQPDITGITADFDAEGMTIDYRPPMIPVTDAKGHGRYEKDTLTIDIPSATIGDMRVQGGRVALNDISSHDGVADIALKVAGPLPTLFSYIGKEPLDLDEERLGIKSSAAAGNADLDIALSLPMIRDLLAEQVVVKASGKLTNVSLPDVVKTMDLTEGTLEINVTNSELNASGTGKLGGEPVTFDLLQHLALEGQEFSTRVKATTRATSSVREQMGIGLKDWIDGPVPVDVTYTSYRGGRSIVAVKGDLGPAKFMIQPFGYEKPAGAKGSMECSVNLQNGVLQNISAFQLTTDRARLRNASFAFDTVKRDGSLKGGKIPAATLDENDFALDFSYAPDGHLNLAVTGAFFDARPFMDKPARQETDPPSTGPAMTATIRADRMRTHSARLVRDAFVALDLDRNGDAKRLVLDATAGKGMLSIRLLPGPHDTSSFTLTAQDAGAALRAFNIYENMRGGTLAIAGKSISTGKANIIGGHVSVENFRVVQAPILARLVNAFSLPGIQQLLLGDGINFARLESDFEWHRLPQGDLYRVLDGKTSGSSVGLTFQGEFDRSRELIDINGTIVPVSLVNELISNIPIVGDIIAGGPDSAIIAATYTLHGPSQSPTVTVNPLAALTPGIFRRLLFEESSEQRTKISPSAP